MKSFLIIYSFLVCNIFSWAQTDSAKKISVSGYVETFFAYDFQKPANGLRPDFFYNHSQHNNPNINLAFVKAAYASKNFRFNTAAMLGTYPRYNLAAEPIVWNRVFELNAGIKISDKKEIWLDAGIIPAHIGFESAASRDCPTVTRSILAENSPYYETGAKISYTANNKKIVIALLAINGWQRIAIKQDFKTYAGGMQITLAPNNKFTINYSNYLGDGTGFVKRQFRHFHNIYAIYLPSPKWKWIAGFDIGFQNKTGNNKKENWFSPVLIGSYAISKKIKAAARAEYYSDKNGIIISVPLMQPFQAAGFSGNLDWLVIKNLLFRAEYKLLKSPRPVFTNSERSNNALTFALIGWF
jgi:Putative beta-barrel porin-2, OmpL-like. bbp2